MAGESHEWSVYDSFVDDADLLEMMAVSPLTPHFAPSSLDHSTSTATFGIVGPVPSRQVPIPAGLAGDDPAEGYTTGPRPSEHIRPPITSASTSSSGRSGPVSTTIHPEQRTRIQSQLGQLPSQVSTRSSAYHDTASPTFTTQPAQSAFDWSPTGNNPLIGSAGAADNPNYFDITHLRPSGDAQSLGSFISPSNIHQHHAHIHSIPATAFDYSIPWMDGSDAGLHTGFHVPDHHQQPKPPSTDGHASELSNNWDETGATDAKTEIPAPGGADDTIPAGESLDSSLASSRRKRAKKGSSAAGTSSPSTSSNSRAESKHERKSSVTSAASASTTATSAEVLASSAGKGPSKLRTAPRTSKTQTRHKPAESAEERRTRASHNLVEKQYRNRLNAQFESLLYALPESVRRGSGAGGEDDDPQAEDDNAEPDPNSDRRLSKAEVLDMARRHILSLERERDIMQREKAELLDRIELLQGSTDDGSSNADIPAAANELPPSSRDAAGESDKQQQKQKQKQRRDAGD